MPAQLSKEQLRVLMSPISRQRVKTFGSKAGSKAGLSYVEAYDIKATLTRIFGFGGFSADVTESKIITIITADSHPSHVYQDGKPKTPQVIAQATVRLHIKALDCTFTETAIGSNSGWDIGDTADNAIKSAASDALKRCATYLGSQFGLSLYNADNQADELVRRILEPEQAKMLAEIHEEWEQQRAEQQAATQAVIDQGTGNTESGGQS